MFESNHSNLHCLIARDAANRREAGSRHSRVLTQVWTLDRAGAIKLDTL